MLCLRPRVRWAGRLHKKPTKHNGFTLIEISIALVIIALIVAGVLIGRDMLHNAAIRQLLKQRDQLESSVQAFRLKYNCLPGDCLRASSLGLGVNTPGAYGENGNGNGIIEGYQLSTGGPTLEINNMWYHLARSNLISFAIDDNVNYQPDTVACRDTGGHPTSPCVTGLVSTNTEGVPGGWWLVALSPDPTYNCTAGAFPYRLSRLHYWWLAAVVGGGAGAAIFTPLDSFLIDSKLDDGKATTGDVVIAHDQTVIPCGPFSGSLAAAGGAVIDVCAYGSGSNYQYNILNENRTTNNMCSLMIGTGF
jgi:prepilin-type N-terminal cleavage/methylation domain-containing protein